MDKTNLLQVLKLVQPALGSPLIQGLDCFHFNGHEVTAFNGAIKITSWLDEPFFVVGAIEGDTLLKLINQLPDNIEFSHPSANVLQINAGRFKTRFIIWDTNQDLLLDMEPSDPHPTKAELPSSVEFITGLKRCLAATGGSRALGEAGIHVFVYNTEAHMNSTCLLYSSNGIVYSKYSLSYPDTDLNSTNKTLFVPALFAEQVIHLAESLNECPNEIWATEKYIWARFGYTILRCSFYSNPVDTKLKAMIDAGIDGVDLAPMPDGLLDAIKRAEIVASNRLVKLKCVDNVLMASASGHSEELEDEIDFHYENMGPIALEIKYLKKPLESCMMLGLGDDYLVLADQDSSYLFMSKTL